MEPGPGRVSFRARAWWRRRFWIFVIPAAAVTTVFGLCLSLTAPLQDRVTPGAKSAAEIPPVRLTSAEAKRPIPPDWPAERLEGRPATQLVLDTLIAVAERLNRIETYTATFHKQERIKGTLGPKQTLAMKVRQRPFAIYFKFLAPRAGKEVVYAEGHHENKMIAHSGGLTGLLVPRLAVPPDHPLALAETRHSVTEAGLANLTAKLIKFRELDLNDPRAVTTLDRTTGPDGRLWYRSTHTHPTQNPDRPFARVVVLYDPETRFPMHIRNYDWPLAYQTGELLLAEDYSYENLDLEASLSAVDFDPANPAYAFHRY